MFPGRRALVLFALLLLLLLTACRGPVPESRLDPRLSEAFLRQLCARLELMQEVARVKWHEKKPITDPQREREMLDRLEARGKDRGLEAGYVRRFFAAQVEAAKLVQKASFDRWKVSGKVPRSEKGKDLAQLRQQIDETNEALLESLVALRPYLADSSLRTKLLADCEAILKRSGFPADVREAALTPLREKP